MICLGLGHGLRGREPWDEISNQQLDLHMRACNSAHPVTRVEVWSYFLPWLSDVHRKLMHINQKWIDGSPRSSSQLICAPFRCGVQNLDGNKVIQWLCSRFKQQPSLQNKFSYKFTNPGENAPFLTSVGVSVFSQRWNLIRMSVPALDIIIFQQLRCSSWKIKSHTRDYCLKIHSKHLKMPYVIQIKVCPLRKCLV